MVLQLNRDLRALGFDARPQEWRYRAVAGAVAAAGLSVAVFVGRDGSAGWRLLRVVVVCGLTVFAVAVWPRLTDPRKGRVAAVAGVITVTSGVGFLPHLVKNGLSVTSLAALVAAVAGLVLLVAGVVLAGRGVPLTRRVPGMAGMLLFAAVVSWVFSPAVVATNVPRPAIGATPASKGLDFEAVTMVTADGVRLAGWYVPSRNRAAVVLRHGAGSTRSNVLDEAAVLARHGFGVLMVDARGHGQSGGRAMDFGWFGELDLDAATRFLASRADVDPIRIGVVGMSMGGEEAIGASASNRSIRAVVAEGATRRSGHDETWLSEQYGWRGLVQEQLERAQDVLTDLLTSATVPVSLRTAVEASGNTRYLLIAAGKMPDERHAAAFLAAGAPDRADTWTVEGAAHTDGLRTAPEEWERRVIGFLSQSL